MKMKPTLCVDSAISVESYLGVKLDALINHSYKVGDRVTVDGHLATIAEVQDFGENLGVLYRCEYDEYGYDYLSYEEIRPAK